MSLTAGDRIAPLIGAPPSSVVMHPNVSSGLGAVLSCFDWPALGRRTRIIASALDFPTVLYACEAQGRIGARFTAVPGRADAPLLLDAGRFIEAIDEETALVVVSAVFYKTAERIDLAPIVKRAKEMGARVAVDLYQAAGTVPLDVAALGVDFALGGSVKWLCGGPGAGYLYASSEACAALAPRLTGWLGSAAPFAFEPPPQRYAAGALRFANGSPHVPALVSAAAGHEVVARAGVPAIRAKSLRQTTALIEACERRGFPVVTPREPERRGGSVTVDVPGGMATAEALARREVLVDYRPGAGLRISPHFYTSDEELVAALDAIEACSREAVASGASATTRY
jgi:kynureninase